MAKKIKGWLNNYADGGEVSSTTTDATTKPFSWKDRIVMTPTSDAVGAGVPNIKQQNETAVKVKAQDEKRLKQDYIETSMRSQATVSADRVPLSGPEREKAEEIRRQRNREIAQSNPDKYKYNFDTGDLVIKESASPSEWSAASFIQTPELVKTAAMLTPSGRDYDAGRAGSDVFINAHPWLAPITSTGRLASQVSGTNQYGIDPNKGFTANNVLGGAMMGFDLLASAAGVGPGLSVLSKPVVQPAVQELLAAKKALTPPKYPFGRDPQMGQNWTRFVAAPEVMNRFGLTSSEATRWLEDFMVKKTGKTIPEIDVETSAMPHRALRYERILHDELFGNTGMPIYRSIYGAIDDASVKLEPLRNILNAPPKEGLKKVFNKLDEVAGKAVDKRIKSNDLKSVINETNDLLSKGLGIKKTDVEVKLDPYYFQSNSSFKDKVSLTVKVNDPKTGWVTLGSITLDNNTNFGAPTLSNKIKQMLGKDITSVKNPNISTKGLIKDLDYPYQDQGDVTKLGGQNYEGTAIGGEIHQALKQASEKYNTNLLSSRTHSKAGQARYLREYLNGRLQGVVDESLQPGWEQKVKDYMKTSGKTKWTTKDVYDLMYNNPDLAPKFIRFKYKDGGNVEASQGGYTDIPFKYNSAWGGQFQMGGNVYPVNYVPQAQNGKKVIIDGKEYNTASEDYKDLYRWGPNDDGRGGIGYFDKKGILVSSKMTLPEVTIWPKNKDTQKFYDDLSESNQYAVDQMVKKYGPVNVNVEKGKGIFSGTAGHYNPFTNTITIDPDVNIYDGFVSEFAHKRQFDEQGKFDVIGDWIFNDLPDYMTGERPYADPGTVEYEAHSIYEPKLRDEFSEYISDDLTGRNYNKFQNGGNLPIAQKGKRVPVYVNDPNDPRLKLYNDSVSVFKGSQNPWHWPGTKVTTKQDYEKKRKLQDQMPYWSFDEDQYKKDKKKGKFKDFNDYVYNINMVDKDPKATDAFNRNTGKHFKEFEKPIEKKLPDGRIKQYWGTYKGKLDDSHYTIYDPVTGSSSGYAHSGNGPDTFLGLFNPNIEPIGYTYYAFDQPYNTGEVNISEEDSKYVNEVLKSRSKKKKDYKNYTYGATDNEIYKQPVQPVVYDKKKYNPNDPRLKQLQEAFDKFHGNIERKTKDKPKPKPKPEPKLKGKVAEVNKLPMGEPSQQMGIRERQMPNLAAPNVEMSDLPNTRGVEWNVEYFDPELKRVNTRHFTTNEEAEEFFKNTPGEKRKYSDVSSVGRMAMGGSIPGSVGFTYARTKGIPSEGPYAKKTMPSAQTGDIVSVDPKDSKYAQNISEAMDYTKGWMNSPMYKKMLEESTGERAYNLIDKQRRAAIEDGKVSYYEDVTDPKVGAGTSFAGKGNSEVYLNRDAKYPDWSNNLAHELSHVTDLGGFYIPLADKKLMYKYATHNIKNSPFYEEAKQRGEVSDLKSFTNEVNTPTETRARLNTLRKMMREQNVYDPFTQPFSKDMFKNYKQMELDEEDKKAGRTVGMDPYQQLKMSYTDEEIEDMMNKISKADNNNVVPIAQNGMSFYQHGLDWRPKGMKNGGKSYKVGKSNIEGVGVFAKKDIKPGDYIGKAHTINQLYTDYDFTDLGKNHNHSENPNAQNVLVGNERHFVATKPIKKGTEITTNYRLQPDLEQPEDFENGGKMTPQKDGYRSYSPYKNLPYIDVDSNVIDTNNIVHDLLLVGDDGSQKFVEKNTGNHILPNSKRVREYPVSEGFEKKNSKKKNGGWLSQYK